MYMGDFSCTDNWQVLVHVCQRWRCLVFASPRGLDLELLCTHRRAARKRLLDIWPDLPIAVYIDFKQSEGPGYHVDEANTTSALMQQHNRISRIEILGISNSLFKAFAKISEMTLFPVLTHLVLRSDRRDLKAIPPVPDSFLDGFGTRLRVLNLVCIPFPALPKLLSTTTHLVTLKLEIVPPSGFISPDAMATGLSSLKKLKTLHLDFKACRSCALGKCRFPRLHLHREIRHSPAVTRTILPALTHFHLCSYGEYVEAFMSQIDTPILVIASIEFSPRRKPDTPLLRHFISRTEAFKAPLPARVFTDEELVYIAFFY